MKPSFARLPMVIALFFFAAGATTVCAANAETARLGIKVLPLTGLVVPHQQLAGYHPSVPVGIGLEVFYVPQFSFLIDATSSWHSGGPGGDSDLRLSSLQLLGRWRWPRRGWTPFAEAGAGGYQAEVEEGQGRVRFDGVGLVFGGGAELPLWKSFLLQAEVRSNWSNVEETNGNHEIWAGHTAFQAWVVYKLP